MTKEQEYTFKEKEHEGGFHNTFQEGCSTCFIENLKIERWKNSMQDHSLSNHLSGNHE